MPMAVFTGISKITRATPSHTTWLTIESAQVCAVPTRMPPLGRFQEDSTLSITSYCIPQIIPVCGRGDVPSCGAQAPFVAHGMAVVQSTIFVQRLRRVASIEIRAVIKAAGIAFSVDCKSSMGRVDPFLIGQARGNGIPVEILLAAKIFCKPALASNKDSLVVVALVSPCGSTFPRLTGTRTIMRQQFQEI